MTYARKTIGSAAAIVAIAAIALLGSTAAAQQIKSKWYCWKWGSVVSQVEIWWGHTAGDAGWACNEWRKSECNGECTASPAP
jgi:hypothetical protein